jgi:predicted transcriptional regulator
MTTIEKGARVMGEEREKLGAMLAAKYKAGASVRELAEGTGRSYGAVHRLLDESGVTFRQRGGNTRGKAGAR